MIFLLFFLILALLILSHEFGHFLFAKFSGVKVEEFGFGFPPRLFGVRKGETLYSVNILPLGGFVKIFGEDDTEQAGDRSFAGLPARKRAVIIGAGVFFNVLLAWALFSIGFVVGVPTLGADSGATPLEQRTVRILEVQSGTPAAASGLEAGDQLVRIESEGESLEVGTIARVQEFIRAHAGLPVSIDVLRGGERRVLTAVPSVRPEEGKGALGITMGIIGVERVPWYLAPSRGFWETVNSVGMLGKALAGFFTKLTTGGASFDNVAGPLGIAVLVKDTSRFGIAFLIQLIALLSVNLALINLIPFPGLDGGRLFFLLIEFVRGSPINQRVHRYAHTAGFILLLLLMLIITYHDVIKL